MITATQSSQFMEVLMVVIRIRLDEVKDIGFLITIYLNFDKHCAHWFPTKPRE